MPKLHEWLHAGALESRAGRNPLADLLLFFFSFLLIILLLFILYFNFLFDDDDVLFLFVVCVLVIFFENVWHWRKSCLTSTHREL
jgi:hypothetical protein